MYINICTDIIIIPSNTANLSYSTYQSNLINIIDNIITQLSVPSFDSNNIESAYKQDPSSSPAYIKYLESSHQKLTASVNNFLNFPGIINCLENVIKHNQNIQECSRDDSYCANYLQKILLILNMQENASSTIFNEFTNIKYIEAFKMYKNIILNAVSIDEINNFTCIYLFGISINTSNPIVYQMMLTNTNRLIKLLSQALLNNTTISQATLISTTSINNINLPFTPSYFIEPLKCTNYKDPNMTLIPYANINKYKYFNSMQESTNSWWSGEKYITGPQPKPDSGQYHFIIYDTNTEPENLLKRGWEVRLNDYMEIYLNQPITITGIVTNGNAPYSCVSSYSMSYMNDNNDWTDIINNSSGTNVFDGNNLVQNKYAYNYFSPINTKCIKITILGTKYTLKSMSIIDSGEWASIQLNLLTNI